MRDYEPRGGQRELLLNRDPIVCISGAAGTGKSLAALMKIHIKAAMVPGMLGLILRQTHASLTASTLNTFEQGVIAEELASGEVKWFGGSGRKPPAYIYPNGSRIIVGGLDQPTKFLGTEPDMALIDEASQVSRTSVEVISSRLRGSAPTYKQLMLATNPDNPAHHLRESALAGEFVMIDSRHSDNPRFVNADGTLTGDGEIYMSRLDALTGVRRARYRDGLWVASEGQVYDDWNDAVHLVDPFPVPDDWRAVETVDWGYQNNLVWQRWRVDGDGRAYLTHEMSRRHWLVEDFARELNRLREENGWGRPEAVVADHDSEDRATFTRHTGIVTTPARKGVARGVQLVQARLRVQPDGKPRVSVFRDSLIRNDPLAASDNRPRGLSAEIGGYVWATERGSDGIPKEAPLKVNDHSCFVAGTPVSVLGGVKAIDDVRPGDLVWTRKGLKPVVWSGVTNPAAEVLTVEMSDGTSLTGTGNHPVWVTGAGWVRLDALRYGDSLLAWPKAFASGSMEFCTAGTRNPQVHPIGSTTSPGLRIANAAQHTCTKMCGSTTMGPYPWGMRSTTSTLTPTTTTSAISRCAPKKITCGCIPNVTACLHSHQIGLSTWNGFGLSQKSGINPTRVVNGTAPMRTASDSVCGPVNVAVTSVVKSSSQSVTSRTHRVTLSVPTTVSPHTVAHPASIMRAAPALSATPYSPSTSTQKTGSAVVSVVRVTPVTSVQTVYNLEVADVHEYFAGGVLVHNCDAARYLVAYLDWNDPARTHSPVRATPSNATGSKWSQPVGR